MNGTVRTSVTLAIVLAVGCAPVPGATTPAPPAPSISQASPVRNQRHNDSDTMYAQMTLDHHRQALRASRLILDRQPLPKAVRQVAAEYVRTLPGRISALAALLKQWREPQDVDHAADISGRISSSTLDRIRSLPVEAAVKSYLDALVGYEEGHLVMAEDLLRNGTNGDAVDIAAAVTLDAPAAIDALRGMVKTLS